MDEQFKKKLIKTGMIVLFCAAAVYAMVYIDVVLRARSAYLEGEKYYSWHLNPELKSKALSSEFDSEKARLDKQLSNKKISQEEYNKKLEIADFDVKQKLSESSIKYAYIWYQTVVELFTPPESKWVKLSRTKMAEAKELWKKELTAKGIKYEDYMLE